MRRCVCRLVVSGSRRLRSGGGGGGARVDRDRCIIGECRRLKRCIIERITTRARDEHAVELLVELWAVFEQHVVDRLGVCWQIFKCDATIRRSRLCATHHLRSRQAIGATGRRCRRSPRARNAARSAGARCSEFALFRLAFDVRNARRRRDLRASR